ncbi:hypothetical protein BC834DRAFT_476689 [Gloeopeniophorella convolvens]|nr:hypothetical protein BC834DRAFT_476689 [Gloeopeniophorella convolvens]
MTDNIELPLGSICAGLYATGMGIIYWTILVPEAIYSAREFHTTDLASDDWRYGNKGEKVAQNPAACLSAHCTGTWPKGLTVERFDEILREIPLEVPDCEIGKVPRIACRVWFRKTIRILAEHGFLKCARVDELQVELTEIGVESEKAIISGTGNALSTSPSTANKRKV